MLVLFIVDLRLFFLLIHRSLIIDWLIVLHLIVIPKIVTLFIDLFFSLLSINVVLVFHVLIAFVIRLAFLHFNFFLIFLMCVAVVVLLDRCFLLIDQVLLVDLILFFPLFHVLICIMIHVAHLLGVVHVAVHLSEVLLWSLCASKVILRLILIYVVLLLHLVLTNEIVNNCFFVVINLILHLQSRFFDLFIFD